jgi:hypothetical protein
MNGHHYSPSSDCSSSENSKLSQSP